jgi:hypothetical protein
MRAQLQTAAQCWQTNTYIFLKRSFSTLYKILSQLLFLNALHGLTKFHSHGSTPSYNNFPIVSWVGLVSCICFILYCTSVMSTSTLLVLILVVIITFYSLYVQYMFLCTQFHGVFVPFWPNSRAFCTSLVCLTHFPPLKLAGLPLNNKCMIKKQVNDYLF